MRKNMKRKDLDTVASDECRVASSRMGIVGVHPAVFVRVASKGLTGYGTWKSAQGTDLKEPILVTIRGSFRRSVTVGVNGRRSLNTEFA